MAVAAVGMLLTWDHVSRWWEVVLVAACVFAAGVGIVGSLRASNYTATDVLAVRVVVGGGLGDSASALSSAAKASVAEAIAFSRAVDTAVILGPVAAREHQQEALLAREVSAAPAEGSPELRIVVTASSPKEALTVDEMVVRSLGRYVLRTANASPDPSLRRKLDIAARELAAQQSGARSRNRAVTDRSGPVAVAAAARAAAAMAAAKLRLITLQALYGRAVAAPRTGVVPVAAAREAIDNRVAQIELFAFAGAIFGLATGVAVAVGVDFRRRTTVVPPSRK